MEDKIKRLVQEAHTQLSSELKASYGRQCSHLREHLQQQTLNEAAVLETRMEKRLSDILQRAQEERAVESRRQTEAIRSVDVKLERTHSALQVEIEQLKTRLTKLEKTSSSDLQLQNSTTDNEGNNNNDAVPAIVRHLNILSRQHKHDRKERSEHLEGHIQAERRRAVQAPSRATPGASSTNANSSRKSTNQFLPNQMPTVVQSSRG